MSRPVGFKPRTIVQAGRKKLRTWAYLIWFDPGATGMSARNVRDAIQENKASISTLEGGGVPPAGVIGRLVSKPLVDLQTVQENDLYTVPTGKQLIISKFIIHHISLSLAGLTSAEITDGTNSWIGVLSLTSVTSTDDAYVSNTGAGGHRVYSAGDVVKLKINTGATAAATGTVDLIGYLVDA